VLKEDQIYDAPRFSKSEMCYSCNKKISALGSKRKNCRNCGQAFCLQCIPTKGRLPEKGFHEEVRICEPCIVLVQKQRSIAKHEQFDAQGFIKSVIEPKKAKFNTFKLFGFCGS
jgi:hypothetical protein